MSTRFARAPHRPEPGREGGHAPNAALLIDFDNVTMGIRSNLAQELRNLLNSEIIKGKVAVQRAYADWRRYPQYIVPLSESSIDLIFAPAYGSTKKNATDIRLAIDAMELVFTRPEIGTFIILSGDSDFSSLVLKLKEYGKYVIGVGIYESSSDLLIQNCDEYYSYTALTGLKRAGEDAGERHDPWELVAKAIQKMQERGDTMRSDRLKQVMLEIDPGFAEKDYGYSKFNKFVQDAAARGLLTIRKLENGQYEVAPGPNVSERREAAERVAARAAEAARAEVAAAAAEPERASEEERRDGRRRARSRRSGRESRGEGLSLSAAFELLERAVRELSGGRERAVRDRDVKRKMLELDPRFDEGALGYPRFHRFLEEAHNAEVVELRRAGDQGYLVALKAPGTETVPIFEAEPAEAGESRGRRGRTRAGRRGGRAPASGAEAGPESAAVEPEEATAPVTAGVAESVSEPAAEPGPLSEPEKPTLAQRALGLLRGRWGSKGRPRTPLAPPPILEGQTDPVAREPDRDAS